MQMEDNILLAFDDLIEIQDAAVGSQNAIPEPEDDFDESALKPLDASTLSAHELDQEVRWCLLICHMLLS
jgi:hypothetical protein